MYLISLVLSLAIYVFLNHFWGEYILLSFDDLKGYGQSVISGLAHVWYIFLWGAGATLIFTIIGLSGSDTVEYEPGEILVRGWWISANAGVFEELIYRWLVFFCAMVTIPFFNFITFGFVEWMYNSLLIPVANWSTLGVLEAQLVHPQNWVLSAAIISASASFRNAHQHLGLFGWVNAWFIGMVMFFLVFNYGILTAIFAHILYDVVIFTTLAAASRFDRSW